MRTDRQTEREIKFALLRLLPEQKISGKFLFRRKSMKLWEKRSTFTLPESIGLHYTFEIL